MQFGGGGGGCRCSVPFCNLSKRLGAQVQGQGNTLVGPSTPSCSPPCAPLHRLDVSGGLLCRPPDMRTSTKKNGGKKSSGPQARGSAAKPPTPDCPSKGDARGGGQGRGRRKGSEGVPRGDTIDDGGHASRERGGAHNAARAPHKCLPRGRRCPQHRTPSRPGPGGAASGGDSPNNAPALSLPLSLASVLTGEPAALPVFLVPLRRGAGVRARGTGGNMGPVSTAQTGL